MTSEAQIHAEVEELRAHTHETKDLYREVCALLFFRYGITPTANKLYQYVRKGSMSAPAEALTKFWEDLREKSRVRIDHPDLPDDLKNEAGALVAALWVKAQTVAHEGLTVFRSEIESSLEQAQIALNIAENARVSAIVERDHARDSVQITTERALQVERDLAAECAGKAALQQQLEVAARQQIMLQAALTQTRRDFASELEKLHEALERSEVRFEAAEKRALLEIDRERTAAVKLNKELTNLRQQLQANEERQRDELEHLRIDLGAARQKLGVAEGTITEIQRSNLQYADELQSLRKILLEAERRQILLKRDLDNSQDNTTRLERELSQSERERMDLVQQVSIQSSGASLDRPTDKPRKKYRKIDP